MRVTFHGAVGEVTGSCHEVEANGHRLLLDCGMIQGSDLDEARNSQPFPFEPERIDAVLLSHAHIDHSGRLPLLVKRGYRGPIYTQAASADLLRILLEDAASLAEMDARRDNEHRLDGRSDHMPLFSRQDVAATMALIKPVTYDASREILPGVSVKFVEAGHILGSACVQVDEMKNGERKTLLFSGDVGLKGTPILRDPAIMTRADLVIMESTYGDRNHRERAETIQELGGIFAQARRDGGNVLIPAFAVGRTQELLYWLAMHWEQWGMSRWSIFLDSPMAAKVTDVYDRHEDLFDEDARKLWREKPHPFRLPNLHATVEVAQSQAISQVHGGAIIIAGSGMCNGGRIRHHLLHNLGKSRNHVVFVGYQAKGTLGRRLVDGASQVRIFREDVPVRAQRHTVGGLSAHADQSGLLEWYGHFENRPPVALVHGEEVARETLQAALEKRNAGRVTLAQPEMTIDV
jgi:metallo-beta-lactamase family protein